jgi:chemotaxis regulatin CheY-phosphate phosphatase CheZ
MTSPKKADAARANGAKGRGPRTQEGKTKSSRNATKLGLSLPASLGASDHLLRNDLRELLVGAEADPHFKSAADTAADAHVRLLMVRQAKQIAMQKAAQAFDQPRAFKKAIQLASSCERYEARAFSKWKKACRRLSEANSKLTKRTQQGSTHETKA